MEMGEWSFKMSLPEEADADPHFADSPRPPMGIAAGGAQPVVEETLLEEHSPWSTGEAQRATTELSRHGGGGSKPRVPELESTVSAELLILFRVRGFDLRNCLQIYEYIPKCRLRFVFALELQANQNP